MVRMDWFRAFGVAVAVAGFISISLINKDRRDQESFRPLIYVKPPALCFAAHYCAPPIEPKPERACAH